MYKRTLMNSVFAAAAISYLIAPVAFAQSSASSPPGVTAPQTAQPVWPRVFTLGSDQIQLYQPQAFSWDGSQLKARAAFAVGPQNGAPNYGFVRISADAVSDDASRSLKLTNIKVYHIDLPMAAQKGPAVMAAISSGLATASFELLASDVTASIKANGGLVTHVENPVPNIVFADKLTVLVPVSGDPVWKPVAGAQGFQRAVNTQAMLLQDVAGTLHVQAAGSWYEATSLTGPWVATPEVPPDVAAAAKAADAEKQADPLLPQDGKPISPPPALLVSTVPTELIQTDGNTQLVPVAGTSLMTMQNADHAVFVDPSNGVTYVLISGRWFTAPGTSGPWTYVPNNRLPADFAKISTQDPKANVLISVSGTPQSKEAAIAATIPQVAVVPPTTTATASYDGAPQFQPIQGTALSYAVNSAEPVIQVHAGENYMVSNGVWFRAPVATGPWVVATYVPPEIYDIPVSSPVHYVTGVRIYGAGPAGISVGYTPAYMGVVVSPSYTVVYGTGYHYPGYVGSVWRPAPATYGFGAGFALGRTGFGYGFSPGWAWGAGVGPHWGPYAGATPFGRGWGFANVGVANIYGRWGGGVAVGGAWGGAGIGVSAWSHGAWGGVGVGFGVGGVGVGFGVGGFGGAFGGFSAYGGHYMNTNFSNHTTINNNYNHNTYNNNSRNNDNNNDRNSNNNNSNNRNSDNNNHNSSNDNHGQNSDGNRGDHGGQNGNDKNNDGKGNDGKNAGGNKSDGKNTDGGNTGQGKGDGKGGDSKASDGLAPHEGTQTNGVDSKASSGVTPHEGTQTKGGDSKASSGVTPHEGTQTKGGDSKASSGVTPHEGTQTNGGDSKASSGVTPREGTQTNDDKSRSGVSPREGTQTNPNGRGDSQPRSESDMSRSNDSRGSDADRSRSDGDRSGAESRADDHREGDRGADEHRDDDHRGGEHHEAEHHEAEHHEEHHEEHHGGGGHHGGGEHRR